MTNPTNSASAVTILKRPTSETEQHRADGAAVHRSPEVSPRQLLSTQEIAERMRLCKDPIALQPADEDEIRKVCQLMRPGSLFSWSLNGFLKHLVSYFASKAVEGSVELIEGSSYLVGKSFWERILGKKIDDKLVTREMWNFCTDSPERFELWITLPLSYEKDKVQMDRFTKLIIYFFAAQALPPLEVSHHGFALAEFGRLLDFVPITDAQQLEAMSETDLKSHQRLTELKRVFDLIESKAKFSEGGTTPQKRFEALEIECAHGISLKVVFGFSRPQTPDHFRLELSPDYAKTLSFELICPSQPWACLHKQLLSRPAPSQVVGRYWAELTLEGGDIEPADVNNSEKETAFVAGLSRLPPGNEFRLAYFCNAISSQTGIHDLPSLTLIDGAQLSPMGGVLFLHSAAQTPNVLHIVGNMQSCFEISLSDVPRCRRVRSHLEICWGQEKRLHVVIPFDSDRALSKVFVWLKQDAAGCLSCLSHTILVLFPNISDLPRAQTEKRNDPRLIDLYGVLRCNVQFSDAAIRFYFLLHGTGSKTIDVTDVIDLPNFILYGTMSNQTDSMLTSLERIYQGSAYKPLFDAIYNRIASIEEKTAVNCRQVCVEQLLLCGEPQIVQQAWTSYHNEIQLPFLFEVGPRLDQHALPFALNRVCVLCPSLMPSEGFQLLRLYLTRLLRQGGPICSNYQPILTDSLLKVLQNDQALWMTLLSDPLLKTLPSPEAPLLECLSGLIGKSEPDVWWGHFLSIRRLLQERGTFETFRQTLSGVLVEALLQSDLRSQEGFPEVYQSLVSAAVRSDTSRAKGIHYKVIEETDVLELPNIIATGVESQQLDSVLDKLDLVYRGSRFAPLLQAIRSRIAALEIKTPAACQQVCYEQLLACEDPKILADVWAKSKSAQQLPCLLEIAVRLGPVALPFALERVCELSRTLPPADAVRLLCVYHELPAAKDRTKIIGSLTPILEANRLLWLELLGYPSVMSAISTIEKSLLWGLRASLKKSELNVWWGQFLGVQKVLQERGTFEASRQELAQIFQAAHVRFDLTGQERFAEIYQPFATEITDVSLRYAFFAQGTKCEGSDVADLPDFIVYGVDTKQLDSVLESLAKVYQGSRFAPLFNAVRSRVEALEAKTVASCRQASCEPLLVCEEPGILESVWARSKSVQRLPFLVEVAPALNHAALPFAISRVSQYYGSLPPADGVRLLCVYLDLLLRRKMTEEASQIKGFLDPLLKAHPAQRVQVLEFPSIPVENESLLESLEAALGKSDLTIWWGQFLTLRTTQGPALDGIFQKALRRFPDVRNQEGFVEVYNSIAQGLLDRNDEAGLLSFLKLLPVTESAAVVLPWYKALIEQRPISTETLTALMETGAYLHLDRTMLISLINKLTEQRNFNVASEVRILCRAASLQPADLPPLLEYFLAYYASGIGDAVLIEDIKGSFSYFVAGADARLAPVIHGICARMDKVQRNDARWAPFAELLSMMERCDLFVEDSVKILESFAGNPPIQCFRLVFPKVSRLSAEQKFRLAKCYGVALGHLKSDKHKDEIVKALPNSGWMQEQLRKDESWEEFTRLFLHLHRGSVDFKDAKVLADALWIAPHLLEHTTCSCFPEFETFLLRYPVKAIGTAEWRPLVTRLVDRNPDLIRQADKTKKSFYEGCRTKAPKPAKEAPKQPAAVNAAPTVVELLPRRQGSRAATSALESMMMQGFSPLEVVFDEPVPLRAKIKEILSKMPVPLERLWDVLTLLERLPGEYELWASFFTAMPDKQFLSGERGLKLLRRGWIIWKHTHPLKDFTPEFSRYWHNAVASFLFYSTETNDLWIPFMKEEVIGLLEKMEEETCENFSALCLQMGALYGWNQKESVDDIVRVLYQIVENPQLKSRVGNVCSNMQPDFQARIYLLLCQHPDPLIQETGEILFTQAVQSNEANIASNYNQILFTLYSVRPFIPRRPDNFMVWIPRCWLRYKATLSWGEACSLTKTVLQFSFKYDNEAVYLPYLETMHALWETLIVGSIRQLWGNIKAQEKEKALFPELTLMLMDRTVRDLKSSATRAKLLTHMRTTFNQSNTFITEESRKIYSLRYARSVFALDAFEDADSCQAASLALDDLAKGLDDFKVETEEKQKCLVAFTKALPLLFNIQEPDLTIKIKLTFNKTMRVLWVINAGLSEEFCWFNLLFALTDSIRSTKAPKRHAVALAVSQVYMNCTHPEVVQKRNGAVPHKMLLDKSQTCLAYLFMVRTDPDFLTNNEWRALIRGIPLESLKKMIVDLNKSSETGMVRYLNSMAVARLIRHTEFAESLVDLCLATANAYVPPLVEEAEDLIQLDCRSHWLVALSELGKRCKELPVGFIEKKASLVSELTEFAIDGVVSEETYQTVLQTFRSVMQDDLEVAQAILIAFNVAEDHPEEMLPKLAELKAEIVKTIESLKAKK